MFDLKQFIDKYIIERSESLFTRDIETYRSQLALKIENKSILVIGGAGTIGASFIKALLPFQPARLFVVDINENGLTELTRDMRSTKGVNVPAIYRSYPIDFSDEVFYKILKQQGPFDIVANFAAHKHVRSEKDHYSIEAMLQNNVVKAKKLLDVLVSDPPQHFFCVSTDKAANPVNVMGASKKLMEEVILSYAPDMPITTARFANVAFSNGSLLAGFLERMMKRQPLSAPSDVKRYFVSPEESGQICMLACLLGNSGDILFPKLDETSMKTFSSIAISFLDKWGYEPHHCSSEVEAKQAAMRFKDSDDKYPVFFFASQTSGEKLFEEFFTEGEEVNFDRFQQIGVIENNPAKSREDISLMFEELQHLFSRSQVDKTSIVKYLEKYLGNFEHHETGISLDQKM